MKLPVLSGHQAVKVFENLGWEIARQKSSHIIMVKEGMIVTLAVPDHKELAKGTFRKLIKLAGIDVDEFVRAMK